MMMKRLLAMLLCLSLCVGFMPTQVLAATSTEPDSYTLDDGYLQLEVSTKNGGFQVSTVEGNRFIKSDDNSFLLYPDENFDTSFTSFRITKNGESNDYIFGREYGFLSMDTIPVVVEKLSSTQISSTWTVDGVAITQLLTLQGTTSDQHGMVTITYSIMASSDVTVETRIMLDTALGYQDYAYYALPRADVDVAESVRYESEYENTDNLFYDSAFFAYDDLYTPSITAYVVDGSLTTAEGSTNLAPDKVSFGHWNNMASSVFDFSPDGSLNFTNATNLSYMTADSAVALYYNLGEIKAGESLSFSTNYGVFSNIAHDLTDKLVMNFTSNSVSMELNDAKDGYKDDVFTITSTSQNTSSSNLEQVAVVIYAQEGLEVWDSETSSYVTTDAITPYTQMLTPLGSLDIGELANNSFQFKATMTDRTKYRKIEIRTYATNISSANYTDANLLSVEEVYVYCPTAIEPTVEFFSVDPLIVYSTGMRNITISGANFDLLADKSTYSVTLENANYTYSIAESNLNISENDNTLMLTLEEEIIPGEYDILFTYNATTDTSNLNPLPSTSVTVSADPEYAPPNFGVVTIEETSTRYYEIKGYLTEEDFENRESDDEVYLEFRGLFDVKYDENDAIYRVEGISLDKVDTAVSNVITINNCVDLEDGSLILSAENGTVTTDIDATLYTSGARTFIWKGVCAITTFEEGQNYELTTYKVSGEEYSATGDIGDANDITIIWPGIASAAQSIAGLALDLRYCNFALWEEDISGDNVRYVVSFGAKLDLSFLIPSSLKTGDSSLTALESSQLKLSNSSYTADELRSVQDLNANDESLRADTQGGAFGVYVNNILFGGEFIGFNVDVTVGIPSYAEGLAEVEGTLHIAVMNSYYEFGLAGKTVIMDDVGISADISFKSYNYVPIPDELSLYVYGFTPGIPIGPYGSVWLQGLGGGISKMYDTFFSGSLVPSLQINLMVQLSLFSVVSGQGDVMLSARGVSFAISDLEAYEVQILDRLALTFLWYPDILFAGEAQIALLGILSGDVYIIYSSDADLIELYGSAAITVPNEVPLIGGEKIAYADVGISNERVWAATAFLGTGVGVTYYWGDENVKVSTGTDLPGPSYGTFAVAYDDETDLTLYAEVSNISLMDTTTNASVSSEENNTKHTVNLGTHADNSGILTLQYAASSLEEAQSLAEEVAVLFDGEDARTLTFFLDELDEEGNVIEANVEANKTANAALSYDAELFVATLKIAFTEEADFNQNFTITTPVSADLILYSIANLPSVGTASLSNNSTVTWDGTGDFDNVYLYAEDSDGVLTGLGSWDNESLYKSMTIDAPESLLSGTYNLLLIASMEDSYSTSVEVVGKYTHVNSNEPTAPNATSITAKLGGDYTIEVSGLPTASELVDGYYLSILTEAGEATDFTGIYVSATEDGVINVGGAYTELAVTNTAILSDGATEQDYGEVERGLDAGESYIVSLSTYNETEDAFIVSKAVSTNAVTMVAPVEPTFSVSYSEATTKIATGIAYDDASDSTIDTIAAKDVLVTITSDVAVTGNYEFVGAVAETEIASLYDFENATSISIPLSDLNDGMQMLTLTGTTSQSGDGFKETIVFSVDATAPVLQLASPLSGGQFKEDGTVTITGYVDIGATLYVSVNGGAYASYVTSDGTFSQEITNIPSMDVCILSMYATDAMGNASSPISLSLTNEGITKYTGSGDEKVSPRLGLFIGDDEYTDKALPKDGDDNETTLEAKIVSASGKVIALSSATVTYSADMVDGYATVGTDGKTSYNNASRGVITASVYDGSLICSTYVSTDTYTLSVVDGTGSGDYTGGSEVTATASTKSGYTFSHWSSTSLVITDQASTSITFTMPYQNVDLVANYTGSDSSGSSSSSSSSSNNTTSTDTADTVITIEVISATADGISTATLDESTITAAITSALNESGGADANLLITQSTLPVTTMTALTIPTSAVEAISESLVESLTIETGIGTVVLDESVLAGLVEDATGDSLTISMGEISGDSLSSAQVALIGDGLVYGLSFSSGDSEITSLSGDVTISIPYTLSVGETADDITLWYLGADGSVTEMTALYDADTASLVITTSDVSGMWAVTSEAISFSDVSADAYYYEAVLWAVANGITTGLEDGIFGPELSCTRAQAVTFLWRSMGSPSVSANNPFSDVSENAYYYEAVLWAVANGITAGTSDTAFSPDLNCDRGQIVTFLYRTAGAPSVTGNGDFVDVSDSAYYADAVLWAGDESITSGTSSTEFSPTNLCTRGQIVTFLYRYIVE